METQTIEGCKVEFLDSVEVECIFSAHENTVTVNNTVSCGFSDELSLPSFLDVFLPGMYPETQTRFSLLIKSLSEEDKNSLIRLNIFSEEMVTEESCISCHLKVYKVHKFPKFWMLTEEEKVEQAKLLKIRGNSRMKRNEIAPAYDCYRHLIRTLEDSLLIKEEGDSTATDLLLSGYLNASLCQLQSNLNKACIQLCRKALKLCPDQPKALYRMAKAQMNMKNYSDAAHLLKEMMSKNIESEIASRNLAICVKEMKSAHQVERTRYEMVFKKMAEKQMNSEEEILDFPVDVWSNDLAKEMMPLAQELEAFGEKMPERRSNKSSLGTIEDEDGDM